MRNACAGTARRTGTSEDPVKPACVPRRALGSAAPFAVAAAPAATAWVLSAGAAVVLGTTMLVAATLPAWEDKRGLYRPLARTSVAVALACLGVGAVRPTPIVLGLALVLLLSIPWGFAVVRRLAGEADRD
jgi:hypothetical protein